MNVHSPSNRRTPVRLTIAAFLTLKRSGAFSAYEKAELLDGELSGVPLQDDDEPESDASVPIKLSRPEYALLHARGALAQHGKTELIDGLVYAMSPQYRRHGFTKDEIAYHLRRAIEDLGSDLHVATEQSVALSPHSEPQPDIILTSEPRGDGPIPSASVRLVVEIADTTLAFDRGAKARIYARANVPEYWVVDVNAATVHQMWSPVGDAYVKRNDLLFGQKVEAATVMGLMVETARVS